MTRLYTDRRRRNDSRFNRKEDLAFLFELVRFRGYRKVLPKEIQEVVTIDAPAVPERIETISNSAMFEIRESGRTRVQLTARRYRKLPQKWNMQPVNERIGRFYPKDRLCEYDCLAIRAING